MKRLPAIGVKKSQERTTFHNDKATIHWSNRNLDNKLLSIMTRLSSIGEKNLNNELPSVMTRIPSIRLTKSQQRTSFHNNKPNASFLMVI